MTRRRLVKNSILVALNDSVSSRKALEFILHHSILPKDADLTLLHVFRKPMAGEDLMGEKFMKEQPARLQKFLEDTRDKLVRIGFDPAHIEITLTTETYPTITEGIIEQFNKGNYSMVVLGRKRMSKAEEFVLGDVGVKLVRALEGVAILIVKA
jgi:nucleotide-binding universal stress UspA family protein